MDSAHPDVLRELRGLLAGGRFREVLDRHRAGGLGAALPEAGLAVATAATRLGELDQAIGLAQDALGRFRTRADEDGRMRTLNLLGAIAFERGDLELASQRFAESLALARALGDRLVTGRALNNLASVVHLRGDAESALSYYREALLVYQQLGDRRGAAETYHNLGLVFRESGVIAEAGRAAEHAVRHATLVGDPGLMGLVITGRAEVALAEGDTEVAEEALDRADQLADRADDTVGRAEVRRVRALVALGKGEFERALAQALEARERAEAVGSTLLQAESVAVAADANRRLGRPAEADRLQTEARRLFSALGALAHLRRLDQTD